MFRNWLNTNNVRDFDFSGVIFEKASNRKFWEPKFNKEWIAEGEKYLGYEWPLIRATSYMEFFKTGNRVMNEEPHFARRRALLSLLIAEIMEYKGRFLPDIVDGIFMVCEETYWGISAHFSNLPHRGLENIPNVKNPCLDLFEAQTGELLSVIYHILYDSLYKFCPEILERIEHEIYTRIILPYTTRKDFSWMGYMGGIINNWNPWILSNILTIFLLQPVTKTTLIDGVKKTIFEANAYYKGMPNDGGCDEGCSYWAAAGGKLFEFCDLLYTATNGKINFFKDEKIKNIGKFIYRVYIGNGYCVNFADGAPYAPKGCGSVFYKYGKYIGDNQLCALAKVLKYGKTDILPDDCDLTHTKRTINNIIYNDEINNVIEEIVKENVLFPDLQVACIRCGEWYYAAKGGHNEESHNHNDVGSFIVYNNGLPVLLDPSCGVYTRQTFTRNERYKIWTMQSLWHNLPVINGYGQLSSHDVGGGKNARADSFSLNENTIVISFAAAYPKETELKNITRSISANDDGITIMDIFDFSNDKNTVCHHFIARDDVKISDGSVIIDNTFVLTASEKCEISTDSVDFNGDTNLTSYWNTDHLNRIIFRSDAGKEKQITFTLKRMN